MQIASLLKLLNDYCSLLTTLGHPKAAQDLHALQNLFVGKDDLTVAKSVGAILKKKPNQSGPESDPVHNLRTLLAQLEALLVAAQSKGANDIEALRKLLEGCSHATIAQFVADANEWLNTTTIGKAGDIRNDVVAEYLSDLRKAEHDNDGFDRVMKKLTKDKRARVAEVRELASQFVGFKPGKKSKPILLQAIADRQALNARQTARGPRQA
jgi:hypothetical protein